MILQTATNVLKLILVAKMATALTRWAHMDVIVMTDTDYEWNPQGGNVQVTQHLSHNKIRYYSCICIFIQIKPKI